MIIKLNKLTKLFGNKFPNLFFFLQNLMLKLSVTHQQVLHIAPFGCLYIMLSIIYGLNIRFLATKFGNKKINKLWRDVQTKII